MRNEELLNLTTNTLSDFDADTKGIILYAFSHFQEDRKNVSQASKISQKVLLSWWTGQYEGDLEKLLLKVIWYLDEKLLQIRKILNSKKYNTSDNIMCDMLRNFFQKYIKDESTRIWDMRIICIGICKRNNWDSKKMNYKIAEQTNVEADSINDYLFYYSKNAVRSGLFPKKLRHVGKKIAQFIDAYYKTSIKNSSCSENNQTQRQIVKLFEMFPLESF